MHTDRANRAQHERSGDGRHGGNGEQLTTAVLHVGGLHYASEKAVVGFTGSSHGLPMLSSCTTSP